MSIPKFWVIPSKSRKAPPGAFGKCKGLSGLRGNLRRKRRENIKFANLPK